MKRSRLATAATIIGLIALSVVMIRVPGSEPQAAQQLEPQLEQQSEPQSEQQPAQVRVRRAGRELIVSVIDVQLKQLEANGLESLDLFGELRSTRRRLDELTATQMPQVVELLARLAVGPEEDRQEPSRRDQFVAVRQKSRKILVSLLAEKQKVLRRLKIAEIAAQTGRILQRQRSVLSATEALPEEAPSRRESLALAAIEDQRDVAALYQNLKQTLADAASFGGSVATEAIGGLEQLQSAAVAQQLLDAAEHLEETRYGEAARSQLAVIQGLLELLQRIQRARGLSGAAQQSVEEVLRQVAGQQEELYRQTSRAESDRSPTDALAEEQSHVHRRIAELGDLVRQPAAAGESLERARTAALEAAAGLFEDRPRDALTEQEKVLKHLGQTIHELAGADPSHAGEEAPQPRSSAGGAQQPAQPAVQPPAEAGKATPPAPSSDSAKAGSPNSAASGPSQQDRAMAEKPSPADAGEVEEESPVAGDAGEMSPENASHSSLPGHTLFDEPWFIQLPPEVRRAIRVGLQQRPPRGYEERLEQYFKNLD